MEAIWKPIKKTWKIAYENWYRAHSALVLHYSWWANTQYRKFGKKKWGFLRVNLIQETYGRCYCWFPPTENGSCLNISKKILMFALMYANQDLWFQSDLPILHTCLVSNFESKSRSKRTVLLFLPWKLHFKYIYLWQDNNLLNVSF